MAGVTSYASSTGTDRVVERRRAVALARHYREFEGLSIKQIADRVSRSPATVKAYFYDPSQANKEPTDSRKSDSPRRLWSSTDVDLQATPRLSLRRYEADVPTARLSQCAEVPSVVIAVPDTAPNS